MARHWRVLSNICGMDLSTGSLWVAEICALIGFGLFIDSSIKLGVSVNSYRYDGTGLVYILPLILGILQLFTSLLLIVGVVQKNHCLVLLWVIVYSVQTILIALFSVMGAIAFVVLLPSPVPASIWLYIGGVLYCEVMRYFILGVYSFYKELKYQRLPKVEGLQLPDVRGHQWVLQPSNAQGLQSNPQVPTIPGFQWALQPNTQGSQQANIPRVQWVQHSQAGQPNAQTMNEIFFSPQTSQQQHQGLLDSSSSPLNNV